MPKEFKPSIDKTAYNRNVAIITIDSLRWDTTMDAKLPNINKLFKQYNANWIKVYAQGTYTLPVHIGIFQDGHLPSNEFDRVGLYYTRKAGHRMFRIPLKWEESLSVTFDLPEAPNMVKSFEKLGYRTVGIGGVNWFNTDYETSNLWKNHYFSEFYWQHEFRAKNPDSLEEQIKLINTLNLKETEPLFFFLNIASTHRPCRGNKSQKGQVLALEYVDAHIMDVLVQIPKPCHLFLLSDHGTCFGEDNLSGHGFYHPRVMEIPMTIIKLT